MFAFIAVLYTIVCVFLILVVLLQAGKGGGMGAAFGGGTSQQVFGGAGAGNFLTRLTWISAVLFMLLSGTLAYLSSSSDKSLERAGQIQHERQRAVSGGHNKAPTKAAGMSTATGDDGDAAAPTAPEHH